MQEQHRVNLRCTGIRLLPCLAQTSRFKDLHQHFSHTSLSPSSTLIPRGLPDWRRPLGPDRTTCLTQVRSHRGIAIPLPTSPRSLSRPVAGHGEPHLLKSRPITTEGAEADGRGDRKQAVRAAIRWGGLRDDSRRDSGGEPAVALGDRAPGMPGTAMDRCAWAAEADERSGGAAAATSGRADRAAGTEQRQWQWSGAGA
jgi:hypothetical protein